MPALIPLFRRIRLDLETGCWNWRGTLNKDGYGEAMYRGKKVTAHRLAAHLWLGYDLKNQTEFPLHRCDNRRCFKPQHLFFGTRGDNIRDCVAKGRTWAQKVTHCPRNHEYTPENTRLYTRKNGSVARFCRECSKITSNEYYYNVKRPKLCQFLRSKPSPTVSKDSKAGTPKPEVM